MTAKLLPLQYETLDQVSIHWFWIAYLKSLSQRKQMVWDWDSLFAA